MTIGTIRPKDVAYLFDPTGLNMQQEAKICTPLQKGDVNFLLTNRL